VLKEGDKAPDFSLESDAGTRVSLADFAGKTLVLYFYPKDSTPGCTRESQAFTAARARFAKAGAAIVGVSRDSVASHCRFRDKYALGVPLLSDPDHAVHAAYGAWGDKVMYGKKVTGAIRSTFVIRDGKVVRVFPNVKVDGHADAVLAAITHGDSIAPPKRMSAEANERGTRKPAAKKKPAKKPAAAKKKPAAAKKRTKKAAAKAR
jgi:peroxiredoxin Q/BCP